MVAAKSTGSVETRAECVARMPIGASLRALLSRAPLRASPRLARRRETSSRVRSPAPRAASSSSGTEGTADADTRKEEGITHGELSPPSWPSAMGRIVREDVAHQRYLTVFDREVEFDVPGQTSPRRIKYDIVGHPRSKFQFSVVFPFHPPDDTNPHPSVTLIREYMQGSNDMGYSLPTGSFDPKKHADFADVAKDELAEEARLRGGDMVSMLPREDHPGFLESKWCANRFKPFVCVAPESYGDGEDGDEAAPQRDAEEFSITVHRVSLDELATIMTGGDMTPPSVVTAHMALAHLRKEGML